MEWTKIVENIVKIDNSIKLDTNYQNGEVYILTSSEYILLKIDGVSGYYLYDAKKDGIKNAIYYSYNSNNELIKFNSLTEAVLMIKKWICNDLKKVERQTKEGVNL